MVSIICYKFIKSIIDIHTLILIFRKSNELFHWTFLLKFTTTSAYFSQIIIVLLMDKERELVWLYGAVQPKDLMMELSLTSSSDRKNLIAWDFVYNEESRRCSDSEFLSEIKEEVVE